MRPLFLAAFLATSTAALSCAASPPPNRPSETGLVASTPSGPSMPGPAAARMHEAVALNAECEACHQAEAAEWRGSLHHRANVEPSYRRAFEREPLAFCRSCHAPEAVPDEQEPDDVGNMGVGCVTCHVTDRSVLASPRAAPTSPREPAPHAIVRDARFATADACEGCHEFRFPTAHGDDAGSFMQTTVREHAASKEGGTSCAACHMPKRSDGRRSHAFLGSRDPAFVRSALRVTAQRSGASEVHILLAPNVSGHAFPTGDLFRRIEITVEALGPDHMVLSESRQYLGRHWAMRSRGTGRVLLRDDRLRDEPQTLSFDLGPEASDQRIAWRVAYQRVAHANGVDESSATVDAEIVLGSGIFNIESTQP